jgi:HD-GYP domain-containing protein (c-di-GMP phosphodiesterase class II)
MIAARVTDWLRPLGAAASAAHLYRPEHPRVVEALEALEAASRRLVGDRASVSLCVVEERLMVDGEVVAGVGPLSARLFEALAASGFDRIVMGRGVSQAELLGLVGTLAGASRDGRTAGGLRSTEHLSFSSISRDARSETAVPAPTERAGRLLDIWKAIDEHRILDQQAIDALITPYVAAVCGERDGALPLAVLESHDSYTATHIGNVALLTMALAEAAGLPQSAIRPVGIAALLHDIGKIRVPATLLSSSGQLSGADLVRMREHPEVGARMLLATPGVPQLAAIVAFEHHLHAAGGGYPEVPPGWRIHPASAMTHVADVYDALRTNRPYRGALSHEEIVDIMQRERGSVFEAELLDAFLARVVPRTLAAAA